MLVLIMKFCFISVFFYMLSLYSVVYWLIDWLIPINQPINNLRIMSLTLYQQCVSQFTATSVWRLSQCSRRIFCGAHFTFREIFKISICEFISCCMWCRTYQRLSLYTVYRGVTQVLYSKYDSWFVSVGSMAVDAANVLMILL